MKKIMTLNQLVILKLLTRIKSYGTLETPFPLADWVHSSPPSTHQVPPFEVEYSLNAENQPTLQKGMTLVLKHSGHFNAPAVAKK